MQHHDKKTSLIPECIQAMLSYVKRPMHHQHKSEHPSQAISLDVSRVDVLPSGLSGVAKAVRVQHGDCALGVEDNPLGDGCVESSLHQEWQT